MLLTQPNRFSVTNRTIKNNHLYMVDNACGEIVHNNDSGHGLYDLDTRFLSCYEIRLNDTDPVCLLSSTEQGYLSTLVYTNGQMLCQGLEGVTCKILEETVQLRRESVLNGALFEKYTITSYNIEPVFIRIAIRFDADFRDIFEVRHLVSPVRRRLNSPRLTKDSMIFSYKKDDSVYETRINFMDFTPFFSEPKVAIYEKMLSPMESSNFRIEIQPVTKSDRHIHLTGKGFNDVISITQSDNKAWQDDITEFFSDNEEFNEMMERSHKDIRMLLTQWNDYTYIAAGIPWFVSLFGRDSLITARECLFINPSIARWTLYILAKYQGQKHDPWRDEEPGKILHELRVGELAKQGLIPHSPYYGSVDSTPLWLILLYDYFLWTNDIETVTELWPNAMAALDWIDTKIKNNQFGYVTYKTESPQGIVHQGWKDSHNSAMYENGLQAEPPIALSEVQGYIYLAKRGIAIIADKMGDKDLRYKLKKECIGFKHRFNKDFWINGSRFCAMGLDNSGRPLRVISSNPGHCLETGILTVPHARQVANRIMEPDMFNGWGIRTLSSKTLAYNPMSYHNGSIWPHDNAIIAKGMSAIGRSDFTEKILTGLFEAARLMQYKRLPELFCGFGRDPEKMDPPVRYPVACSPQAWSAASGFSLIRSMLNITPELETDSLKINQPHLPSFMNLLRIKKLKVGNALVDLEFKRAGKTVVVDVLNRQGRLDIMVKK